MTVIGNIRLFRSGVVFTKNTVGKEQVAEVPV